MPKVSVIVPVYNVEKYLNRCVDSILNQSFEDFELILVNDGSTDNSGKICDEYKQKDNRVRVIHKENGGVSTARNTGIDAASGEYIMFVDSDDYIYADMLKNMITKTDKDIDLVVSSIEMRNKDSTETFTMPDGTYSVKQILEQYCAESFPRICLCGPCCKFYKRSIIKDNNVFFDTDLSLGEDTCFNMQYLLSCRQVVAMSNVMYQYIRQNESSLFTKFQTNTFEQSKKVLLLTEKVMVKIGCNSKDIHRLRVIFVRDSVGNLIKAVRTVDKNCCKKYMKQLSTDCIVKNNVKYLKGKTKVLMTAVMLKNFSLVYYICKFNLLHHNIGK